MNLFSASRYVVLVACLAPSFTSAATWQELVAECERLLPPMLPVEQAQALLPQTQMASTVQVSGHLGKCWLTFEASENATFRPRGITPLLSFALTKGEAEIGNRQLKPMYRDTPEFRFRVLDAAAWPGVDAAYAHRSMGRHWLVLELGDRGLTVQMSEELPAEQLEPIARALLDALAEPDVQSWMRR